MRTGLLAVACVGLLAGTVAGQTPVVNPTIVEFQASADHALVVRYDLQIYQTNHLEVSYRIIALGKPTPDPAGTCTVVFSTLTAYPLPDGEYVARVTAWTATGGSGASDLSNVFTFIGSGGSPPPMKPTGVIAVIKIGG